MIAFEPTPAVLEVKGIAVEIVPFTAFVLAREYGQFLHGFSPGWSCLFRV
jgi:hypothetical protein